MMLSRSSSRRWHVGIPSEAWREAFAVVVAILVGGT
jgi:hypothetical protein